MKTFNAYINEKLVISKNIKVHEYYPKTKEELQQIIIDRIKNKGPNCDLNDIYTGDITDMSELFYMWGHFNCDISNWDVSNVTDMRGMFGECASFKGDLSKWNVSKVESMKDMFFKCKYFNSDISNWNVSKVANMSWMFGGCSKFNQDLSGWDVHNVKDISYMFYYCGKIDGKKLENWKFDSQPLTKDTFEACLSYPSWWEDKNK